MMCPTSSAGSEIVLNPKQQNASPLPLDPMHSPPPAHLRLTHSRAHPTSQHTSNLSSHPCLKCGVPFSCLLGLSLLLQNPVPTSLPKTAFPAWVIALTALPVDWVMSTYGAQTPFPRCFGPHKEHLTGYKHRTILFILTLLPSIISVISPSFLPWEEASGKSRKCLFTIIHPLTNND